jgi:hypothetical protein
MQKVRVNKIARSDFAKRALKRATKWYARERNIPGGLSSYQIEKKVKQEYSGVGPHATTICRYVNTILQGFSPLKIGVRGDVPSSSFQLLCLAFESYVWIMQINSKEGEITFKTSRQKSMQCFVTIIARRYCNVFFWLQHGTWMHRLCTLLKIIEFVGPPTQIFQVGLITFSKPFFSQCNLVDMVCRMNIHQDGF